MPTTDLVKQVSNIACKPLILVVSHKALHVKGSGFRVQRFWVKVIRATFKGPGARP